MRVSAVDTERVKFRFPCDESGFREAESGIRKREADSA